MARFSADAAPAGLAAPHCWAVLAAMRDSSLRPLRWLAVGTARCFAIRRCWCSCSSGTSPPGRSAVRRHAVAEQRPSGWPAWWPSFEFRRFLRLTLYSTAFIAEEIRSGIRGVAGGQKYAAQALGLTGWRALRELPQALKIALPPLPGQYMNVIKNSSLTTAIGVAELSTPRVRLRNRNPAYLPVFGVATVLYIAIIALLEGWGMAPTA